jgi:glycosyltransferase involved in cell wall biosynthesis
MPEISVIVPTRQRNHLLPRALRSLLAQTFPDFEVLVVDDNPPETRVATAPELEPFLADPKVRVLLHDTPRNAAAARNVALHAARGEWITFLDDDDAYQPAKLEKQWQRARAAKLPMGICGLTFHLRHRQRRQQLAVESYAGEELLLVTPAMPTLFHRRAPGILFNETFDAGEDAYYFYQLMDHFRVKQIFNIPASLVDVYPQPGPRVNTNAEGAWQANQAIHRDFAPAYGQDLARIFWLRARLNYLKLTPGRWGEMARVGGSLLRWRGRRDLRLVLNALGYKVPALRRWLVG